MSHELIHGYNGLYDKETSKRLSDVSTQGQIFDAYKRDFSFTNKEEEYTTTLANQVNENLNEDERTNYAIVPYTVKNSTTTEPLTTIPVQ